MSAETFVFTQLQSGALPTELSEVSPRTWLHYLIPMNPETARVRVGEALEHGESPYLNKGGFGMLNTPVEGDGR